MSFEDDVDETRAANRRRQTDWLTEQAMANEKSDPSDHDPLVAAWAEYDAQERQRDEMLRWADRRPRTYGWGFGPMQVDAEYRARFERLDGPPQPGAPKAVAPKSVSRMDSLRMALEAHEAAVEEGRAAVDAQLAADCARLMHL
jgi:hypothetical protein